MTQIAITRTAAPKQTPPDETLAFGKVFSDHMFLMNYEDGKGWHNPRIEPYAPFTLDPATCVLHYGQAIFDGLKAFRGTDGQIRLFRLPDHARRLNKSAHYLCIPELDPAQIEELIRTGVATDGMIPKLRGCADTVVGGAEKVIISGWSGPGSLDRILRGDSGTVIRFSEIG